MRTLIIAMVSLTPVFSFALEQKDRTTYVCTARSVAGRRYSATGTDRVVTQEAAMQQCQANSWRCYPTGCNPPDKNHK